MKTFRKFLKPKITNLLKLKFVSYLERSSINSIIILFVSSIIFKLQWLISLFTIEHDIVMYQRFFSVRSSKIKYPIVDFKIIFILFILRQYIQFYIYCKCKDSSERGKFYINYHTNYKMFHR